MLNEKLRNNLLLVLEHIHEALSYFTEIETPEDFVATKQGKAYYDAILMRLQVTGELLKKSYVGNEPVFKPHTQIAWNEIIRMRDLISHHYDKLQHEVVFDLCENELPKLKEALGKIVGDGNINA